MSHELSDDARSLIRRALAEEAPAAPMHRNRLRRAVIARAAAGGGAAVLLGTSVAKAGGKSLLAAALGSAGIGVGAGLVFAAAAHFAFDPPSAPRALPAVTATPAVAKPSAPRAAAKALASAEPEPINVEPVPEPVVAAPQPARSVPSDTHPAPAASAGSALRAELDLMAEVQGALRDHQGARALQLIATYDARFPHGALQNERLAAEVFAACQVGDQPRAERVAAKFLQADSSSALAARVKSACASTNSGGS